MTATYTYDSDSINRAAIAAFQSLVAQYGFDNALRYQDQAYNADGDKAYLEFQMGLPYGYFKQAA